MRVGSIQLQYTAATYVYKYGWKYAAEGSVYSAVFLSYIVVAYIVAPALWWTQQCRLESVQAEPWQQPTTAKEHDALDPRGECVANKDDGNVAMWLLAASWRQKQPAAAQLRWKGATTYQP